MARLFSRVCKVVLSQTIEERASTKAVFAFSGKIGVVMILMCIPPGIPVMPAFRDVV